MFLPPHLFLFLSVALTVLPACEATGTAGTDRMTTARVDTAAPDRPAIQAPPTVAKTKSVTGAAPWPPPVGPVRSSRCSAPVKGSNRTFNVGPGKQHEELTTVPWLSLGPGDVVNIFHRPEPYRTKVALTSHGSPERPIVINGVSSPDCMPPEVSGDRAVTANDAAQDDFYDLKWQTDALGVFFLYRSREDPWEHRPRHITFQNLKITGAHPDNVFINQDGKESRYVKGAAGIYAVVADHITIDNCEVTGNSNGIFFNSKSREQMSNYVILRNNRIYGNGVVGSDLYHNIYVQVRRALYEGNHVGQLMPGARGSALKDRSSGTVIRFNRVDGGARVIDLVEIEEGVFVDDPLYPDAWVYGNLLTTDFDRPSRSSSLMVHFGGDVDETWFRRGTLYFFNNTVVIKSRRDQRWYVSILDLSTDEQTAIARNNVFFRVGDTEPWIGYEYGTINLSDVNFVSPGWRKGGRGVTFSSSDSLLSVPDPGLDAWFRPLPGSVLVDLASDRPVPKSSRFDNPTLRVSHEFSAELGLVKRIQTGAEPDLGAFEAKAVN